MRSALRLGHVVVAPSRSAFAAILALALIPAAAQSPRAPIAPVASRSTRRPIEAFDPRDPSQHALRRAGDSAAGWCSTSPYQRFRRPVGAARRGRRRAFPRLTDKGNWLRGRIVYRGRPPIAIADAEMAPMLGPDGKPLAGAAGTTPNRSPSDGGMALCRHRARQPDRALRLSARTACARAASRSRCRPASRLLPNNKSIECARGRAEGRAARRHADRDLRTRPRRRRQPDGLPDRRPDRPGDVSRVKRTDDFDVSDCAATAGRRSAAAGAPLLVDRAASPCASAACRWPRSSRARWSTAATLIVADMGYQIDNMEGLAVHRNAARRAGADDDLRRNFSPLQRNAAAAVHAGRTNSVGSAHDLK